MVEERGSLGECEGRVVGTVLTLFLSCFLSDVSDMCV